MQPLANAMALIGNTPMVRVANLDTGPCELYLKLENMNPTGSVKDRIGLSMIEAAEASGELTPGGTIVEGTAGNTGLALALVAQQKGYRMILVIPDKMSREKIFHLKAMGAEVVMTRSDVAKGHPEYYQDKAAAIAQDIPGAVFINQFGNPANPLAHERGTGPEILRQMDGRLDAVVCGVGSSGTMTGLSRYFAQAAPAVELVLADPEGSVLAEYVRSGHLGTKSGSWLVEGIGEDFIPSIADLSRVSQAITISDKESLLCGRELLRCEGILGGTSTGTCVAAALHYCRAQSQPKRVVSFVCDTGNKYLSKMYNNHWLEDQGFIERRQYGDLRDLIRHPYAEHDTVVVTPDEPLTTAYARMKLYDVSQLPVMQDDRLVGIIDESDVLMAVYGHEDHFKAPVREAMITQLQELTPSDNLDALVAVFQEDHVAIVTEGDSFHGLITRIDLLNYLRRRID
ncbi:cysteine synthase [Litchfieldella anticariensis FP35 = DSM 16096]|uniref:Cysteine synthase B n=1 Tax=Litchfieldella anticariensis (strain DSM 16096 / CECT 5854 / CIP 108499 / LMG 22089 / FP35) TaxID=1121939 RepID=S2KMA4_LITA3|nr:cystathionine beta-synthase [Halomonas anticariensis]EPC03262.1 cysteine synthase [Halomonas anticariensis FP35 = DSM 16096]